MPYAFVYTLLKIDKQGGSIKMLRVRVHLNLAQADNARSTIQMLNEKTGRWIAVGYADGLLLKNVKTVVNEKTAKKIASGKQRTKSPHAFIEGDLISWVGELREKCPSNILLTNLETFRVKTQTEQERFQESLKPVFNHNVQIGYNPKLAACFYKKPKTSKRPFFKFLSANRVAVCGWSYAAFETRMQVLKERELIKKPAAKTDFEKSEMAKGVKATKKRKQSWGLK